MHLIFDLDGTLIDSRSGIRVAFEQAMGSVLPNRSQVGDFKIDSPIREAFQRTLADLSTEELDQLEAAFRKSYDDNAWQMSFPFPGVHETLDELVRRGWRCYVVTNKPSQATGQILAHLDLSRFFDEVLCPDSRQPTFQTKAEMIRHLLEMHNIRADYALYVGDSADDSDAAEACEVGFIGTEYGYGALSERTKQLRVVLSFGELLSVLPGSGTSQTAKSGEQTMISRDVFDELFVLELANNHWGDVTRGLRIIKEFGTVVRYNGVRAAIKLQVRDVDTFIHKAFRDRQDIRYIKKTLDTRLSRDELAAQVEAVRRIDCVRMATPFDEKSIDLCMELGIEIIKVASSDVTDWPLLEKVAKTHKPVLVSTGGTSLKDIDNMVLFFEHRDIPLAINHCVSLYPCEDAELQLNQIDFLKRRYPGHIIGLSTHDYHDSRSAIMIAYAKGARTFERHIDIRTEDRPFSPYCSTPEQIAEWFQAFKKAKEMCGAPGTERVASTQKEMDYLTTLVRGVYAKRDLPAGHILTPQDYYLAIPLQKGQLSCRELLNDQVLAQECKRDGPLMVDMVDSLYNRDATLKTQIYARGL